MSYLLSAFLQPSTKLSEELERDFLRCVDRYIDIFPLELPMARDRVQLLRNPDDLDRSQVPKEFGIRPDGLRIPLSSPKQDAKIVFLEADGLYIRSQIHIELNNINPQVWSADTLLNLVETFVGQISVEHAYFCERKQLGRDKYRARRCRLLNTTEVPLGVFWINFFSKRLVQNIGWRSIWKMKKLSPAVRNLPSGLLFASQEEAFVRGRPADEARLDQLEEALDYPSLIKRFPFVL